MSVRPDPRVVRTRARALDAAYALLLERGFGNVTVDEVSARARVAKSTLYRHWDSRDALLREAFSRRALDGSATGTDLRSGLLAYALAFAEGLERAWGRAAASLAVAALDDPEQRRVQQEFVQGYRADLTGLVRDAVGRGELAAVADADVVLDRLIASLFHRFLFDDRPVDRQHVECEVAHALEGLRRSGVGPGRPGTPQG